MKVRLVVQVCVVQSVEVCTYYKLTHVNRITFKYYCSLSGCHGKSPSSNNSNSPADTTTSSFSNSPAETTGDTIEKGDLF